jgi:hypothetical protein
MIDITDRVAAVRKAALKTGSAVFILTRLRQSRSMKTLIRMSRISCALDRIASLSDRHRHAEVTPPPTSSLWGVPDVFIRCRWSGTWQSLSSVIDGPRTRKALIRPTADFFEAARI